MNIDKPTDRPLGHRDAFHVPAIVTSCNDDFVRGGDKVEIQNDFSAKYVRDGGHGIVNPFATHIPPGEKFYVFLYPGLVHNLVHSFDVDGINSPSVDISIEEVRRSKEEVERENNRLKVKIEMLEGEVSDLKDEVDNLGECAGCY